MRIIAGQHRGRKLLGPAGRETTRPITDRVKTSLFDRLAAAERLEGAVVLDLFAGTGSMGLECLSRGAAHVTFIEKDREALRRLRRNLRTIGQEDQARALSRDILSPALPAELAAPATSATPATPDQPAQPFTLIFVDPPFALIEDPKKARRLCDRLADLASPATPATPAAADDAWLFLRTPKQTEPPSIPKWRGPDSKTHGSMTLHRYRKPPEHDSGTLSPS